MLQTIKYNLFHNWNAIRIIRLVLSVIIIIQAVQIHDVLFGLLGVFFLYQALSNTGCCAMNTCSPTPTTNSNTQEVAVEFEEIKNIKDRKNAEEII